MLSSVPQQHSCTGAQLHRGRSTASVLVHAARQQPDPWDVIQPQQQTTAWQQRQQQQLNRQRGPRRRQQRPSQPGPPPPLLQQEQGSRNQHQHFAACHTYQALYVCACETQERQHPDTASVQQQPVQLTLEQSAAAQHGPEGAAGDGQQVTVQHIPAVQLSAGDCVGIINQLAVIMRQKQTPSSSGGSPGNGANQFVEDQALQHTLALVYAALDQLLQPQQQGQQEATQAQHPSQLARQQTRQGQADSGASLSPQQLLRCVRVLAGLKYNQPVQLAAWLESAAAADQPAGRPTPGAAAVGVNGGAGAAAGGISSYRQVLMGLRVWELSTLISHLGRAGARPSNVWLLGFMQVAQQRLSGADLPQLAALLSGLVKLGVKPTTSWMDSLEDRAQQCLLQQAVQHQVTAGQQHQHQDQQQQQQQPAGAAQQQQQHRSSSNSLKQGTVLQQQQRYRGRTSSSRSSAGCQLHHVAQLLTALAEARHVPKPQLAAVLWGATADSLAAADGPALVELLVALAELQLVPPDTWLQQYFVASSSSTHLQQYKPWQLSSSIAAGGKLAAARSTSSDPSQQQQQQVSADPLGCNAWACAMLGAVQQQLSSFAARDLAALLSGLAALQLQVEGDTLQQLFNELQGKLPRLNTAGLAAVTEAAYAFTQQWQSSSQAEQQQQLSTAFMEALLREVAVKLPVFPADDLSRVLLAVAAAGTQPSQLWVQAAAAQLVNKLTLLQPVMLMAVLDALVALGAPPDKHWLQRAVAALDGRLVELSGPQLQQMLALLSTLGVAPPAAWLDTADWAMQQGAELQQKQQQEVVLSVQQ